MQHGMAGLNGVDLPAAITLRLPLLEGLGIAATPGGGSVFVATWSWIVVLAAAAWLLPNTQEVMARFEPAYSDAAHEAHAPAFASAGRLTWRPSFGWAVTVAALTTAGLLALPQVSEFLYFQF